MKKICLATNNIGKAKELNELLCGEFEILSLAQIGCFEDIAETAESFQGNSLIKAKYVFDHYHVACIADDSGLEVESLGGAPGVYSARYAGEHGNHEKNMNKLLIALENEPNRKAQFRTCITYIDEGKILHFEGIVLGEITKEKQGSGGFGYDPIFKPAGYEKTFAQMSSAEKNPISHRGKAIAKLLSYLQKKD